eukprot:GHVR01038716.1.p4 GENE.GHVR01038716.1~~GHVR01038716.1.p4  ORF type:complete len:101 (-),score=9.53 GHVR01038716.1:18-320(-)
MQQRYKPFILEAIQGDWMLVGTSDAAYDISTYEGRVGYDNRTCTRCPTSNELGVLVISCAEEQVGLYYFCGTTRFVSTTSAELHALSLRLLRNYTLCLKS